MPAKMEQSTRGELIVDGLVHAVGVPWGFSCLCSLAGLAASSDDIKKRGALWMYGLGIVGMLTCSAIYNTLWWTSWHKFLVCLDKSMIFVMIAGTYTPFVGIVLQDWPYHMEMLCFIWTVALLGMALTIFASVTCQGPEKAVTQKRLTLVANTMYLGLGWSALMIIGPLSRFATSESIKWMVGGGVLYSVGFGCFFVNTSMPYQHCIWHMFVLAAAAAHYQGVMHGIGVLGRGG